MSFFFYDSFTRQKVVSTNPLLAQYSSLYNYAVAAARTACYMDLSGNGIKEASKLFQQAAWIFEQLQTMVTSLSAGESSADFTKEALSQNSNLCLAQAQYLFFKKASDAGMKPQVLSQVATNSKANPRTYIPPITPAARAAAARCNVRRTRAASSGPAWASQYEEKLLRPRPMR